MLAQKRLQREVIALQKEPPAHIRAKPMENDILTFHYVIEGPADSPFAGGFYHGVLKFPHEYPLKPPGVLMYTPNGRFQQNTRICLTMSDFHPETWNPVWSVSTILVGLLSFMLETTPTVGSMDSSAETKRRLAAESLGWNVKNNKDFCRLFPELVALHSQCESDRAAAEAAAASAASKRSAEAAAATAAASGADASGTGTGAGIAPVAAGDGAKAGTRGGGGGGGGGALLPNVALLIGVLALVLTFAWLNKFERGAAHGDP